MKTRSSAKGKEYEIDKIVDRKFDDKDNYLYRVRWKGYGAEDDSWRSLDELKTAKEAVAEYDKKSLEEGKEGWGGAEGGQKRIDENVRSKVSNGTDEDEDKVGSRRKAAKVTHFADSVEKLEQRIVGGNWQKVVENLKE